jgi:hypothetical protein
MALLLKARTEKDLAIIGVENMLTGRVRSFLMEKTNKEDLEVVRMDEDIALKATAGNTVGGSIPSASVESDSKKPKKPIKKEDEIKRYKLNIYRLNGTVRSDINKGVYQEMGRKWGDVIRCIPSHRLSTFEEILQFVWDFEARQYRKAFERTRKQVELAVTELEESGFLITKTS